ncbi:MAG: elongation factor P--(R)-beta-lysine ligase [Chlamydiales bacterium]
MFRELKDNSQRLKRLHDRAFMLRSCREFFFERDILEVDCPQISSYASVDTHIDLINVLPQGDRLRYLISSPEYPMKRLIAEGIGDCYQLSHVFRDGESGSRHNPEFTLIEWYRIGYSFEAMIEEAYDLIRLFLGNLPAQTITYQEAFLKFAGINPFALTSKELWDFIKDNHLPIYAGCDPHDYDELLNLILANMIEPYLGKKQLTALIHFPSTQAALAKVEEIEGIAVAKRFEIYYEGAELANGYDELQDSEEQRLRFEKANKNRRQLGKDSLPIDFRFLEALRTGLPPCCGVAVGFDRLMMLRHHVEHIESIIPFSWDKS